jgi:hypothetical protein
MNMLVGSLTVVPVLMVAVAHLLWSLGLTWPIRDEALLVKTVVGRPGATRMPNRLLTFVIAVVMFAIGVVALSLADHDSGGLWLTLIGAASAAGFLVRGIIGYTAGWRRRYPAEPFATHDRKFFSPLSLWIGAGFLILVLMRLL